MEMALRRVGDVLAAKYRIEALLGTGGMGDVYRATNMALNREVAIKLLHLKHAEDPALVERFIREARVANVVRHPNVVDVLDIDKDTDGSPFIVQELLHGEDLSKYVRQRGRLTLEEIRTLVVPIIDAVAEAHSHGVIHRDIKPANVFLANQHGALEGPPSSTRRAPRSGIRVVPKLLDFGISKLRTVDIRATDVGVLLGTPAYMAPELLRGVRDADARSDVWAIGVMLFELLAGKRPFVASGPSIFVVIATTDAPPLCEVAPDVDPGVAEVVDRCLRRATAERFASASELSTALSSALLAASVATPTVSVPPGVPLEAFVPELDLPRTLSGAEATLVDAPPSRPPSSVHSTLPSRVDPPFLPPMTPGVSSPPLEVLLPEAPQLSVPPPRRSVAPRSSRAPRSSGLELDASPRTSLPPAGDRAQSPHVAMHQPAPRSQSQELGWLTSALVLGIAALALSGALMSALRGTGGLAIVRLFGVTSPPITIAVQAVAALVAVAVGAQSFRRGMREWQAGAWLAALAYAGGSGALLCAALKLLGGAW